MDKQHILEEIRRSADANNGIPLGKDRFFSETGIKENDWSGKYWARWGDAIKEAGYAPNQLATAFPREQLLEHFVAVVRELQRVPVNSELKLKRRADPCFPSHNVFVRFGNKSQLLAAAIDFCRERIGLEDVVRICEAAIPPVKDDEQDANDPIEINGFVYLIRSGRFYKVGRTNAVGRRERELAIQLPEKATTVHCIRTDDPPGIEEYWHKRFASRRKNGEWFELSRADISAFKRRKFM